MLRHWATPLSAIRAGPPGPNWPEPQLWKTPVLSNWETSWCGAWRRVPVGAARLRGPAVRPHVPLRGLRRQRAEGGRGQELRHLLGAGGHARARVEVEPLLLRINYEMC